MKKIRLFGLLATVMLLAFGLAFFGCSSDSDSEDSGGSAIGETLRFNGNDSQGRDLTIIFYEVVATARNYEPKSGDRYEILLADELISSGRITKTNNVVTFISDDGDTFYGALYGSSALSIASIPSSEGAISGFTSDTTSGLLNPGRIITYSVTANGRFSDLTTTELAFTFSEPFGILTADDIAIRRDTTVGNPGTATKGSTLTSSSDNRVWTLAVDVPNTNNGQGLVFVRISNPWIETGEKPVAVFAEAATGTRYIALPEGLNEDDDPANLDYLDTAKITFELSATPSSPALGISNIVITPAGVVTITEVEDKGSEVFEVHVIAHRTEKVNFRINHAQVDPTVYSLDIYKWDLPINFTVAQIGGSHTTTPGTTTSHLRFTFDTPINLLDDTPPELVDDGDFTIANIGAGAATVGSDFDMVPGSGGRVWDLSVTSVATGTVAITIGGTNAALFDPTQIQVQVIKSISYSTPAPGRPTSATAIPPTYVTLTFDQPVHDLLTSHIIPVASTTGGSEGATFIPGTPQLATSHNGNRIWQVPITAQQVGASQGVALRVVKPGVAVNTTGFSVASATNP